MKLGWCGLLLLVAATPAAAQSPPEPIRLTVRPATAPVPALKYRLLPVLSDETPGNAALTYLRAQSPEWWRNLFREPNFSDKLDAALKAPLKDFPRKEFGWVTQSNQLRELDLAARMERCSWQMTARLKSENIGMLLPEVQGFRTLAKLLALRARLEIADGHFDRAVSTMQTGFALSRHLGEYPILICSLVSAAVASEMMDQLDTLLEQPGAPNLYWALADLPERFIDLRLAFQGEALSMSGLLPSRQELESGPLTPEQAAKLLAPFLGAMDGEFGRGGNSAWQRQLAVAAITAKFYPRAKQYLLEHGHPAGRVEAMPAVQVVMLFSLGQYERLRDELFKWVNLPYRQARAGMDEADKQLTRARRDMDEGFPFASQLLPAVVKVNEAAVRIERRLQALRAIEAVRLHAAAHGGKPPERLDEITAVPVPVDPATGRPFDYHADGDRVTLSAPPPKGHDPHSGNSFRYELTFTR